MESLNDFFILAEKIAKRVKRKKIGDFFLPILLIWSLLNFFVLNKQSHCSYFTTEIFKLYNLIAYCVYGLFLVYIYLFIPVKVTEEQIRKTVKDSVINKERFLRKEIVIIKKRISDWDNSTEIRDLLQSKIEELKQVLEIGKQLN